MFAKFRSDAPLAIAKALPWISKPLCSARDLIGKLFPSVRSNCKKTTRITAALSIRKTNSYLSYGKYSLELH